MGGEDRQRYTPETHPTVASRPPAPPRPPEEDDPAAEEHSDEPPAPLRLEIGRLLEGRLRIVRLLGRGGMSEVYEAYDEQARRTVAVKLMLGERAADTQRALFAEARALVGFRHPHVVGFFGVGAFEAQPFIELESAPGGSLVARVETEGALPPAEALELLVQVADGLAALHAAGIVHRDIKADNILVTGDGRPVIADFGLALHAELLPTLPHGIAGTPAYMAPEAILGITETFEHYAAADQYSLAVTAYFALTGTLPFDACTPSGLFYAQMALEPEAPSQRRPEVPAALDAVLAKALAKRPADRYPSIAAFRDALADVRAAMGPPPGPPRPPRESGVRSTSAPSLKPTVVAA